MILSLAVVMGNLSLEAQESFESQELVVRTQEIAWYEDFDEAVEISIKSEKPLFILFLGSDWCQNCMVLQKEILNHQDFVERIKEKFVFVKVDFPLKKKLSHKLISRNQSLKEEFQIKGFPTVVICLPSGEKLYFAGRYPSHPTECAELFISELQKTHELNQALYHLEKADRDLSMLHLEELYVKARLVGKLSALQKIMDAGLAREDSNAFFLKEKYRLLVDSDENFESEKNKIQQQLVGMDPDGTLGLKLFVAVIDFQDRFKKKCSYQEVCAPLENYLKDVKVVDKENKWRVELMLANYLSSINQKLEAIYWSKLALHEAPEHLRSSIESNLSVLQNSLKQ